MKRLFCLTVLGLAIAAYAGIDAATAKKELDAVSVKAKAAFAKKDAAFLSSLLADNFIWKRKDGRPNENKKQATDNLKMWFGMASDININWVSKSFSVKGNTATIVTGETMTCKMVEKGKPRVFKSMGSIRETWVRGAKGWRATMFEDMGDEKIWMDGKPFDPKKMGGG